MRGIVVPSVPPMSCEDAEKWGEKIVRGFRPELFLRPGPFPVPEFFEFHLVEKYHIKTGPADLPPGVEGVTSPDGTIQLAGDVYDAMFMDNPRARFAAAHEGAHGIVHLPTLRRLNCKLIEGSSPSLYRRQELPAYRDPEWQANRIAAAVLVPVESLRALTARFGKDLDAVVQVFLVSWTTAQRRLLELERLGWL